jgi:hypothetical protein
MAAVLVLLGITAAAARGLTIPEGIRAPAGEKLLLKAHASGAQIYVCQAGADGHAQWTLKAPEAELRDDTGKLIIHHFAGPTWQHEDGSEVTGKAVARADSPDPGSVPWLLLSASGHSGTGVLARVTSVQRLNTRGGQPPAGEACDGSKVGSEARSPYTADYYFYYVPSR